MNMRVTLATPHDGHQADETITVSRAVGLDLIHTGRARAAEAPKSRPASKPAAQTKEA